MRLLPFLVSLICLVPQTAAFVSVKGVSSSTPALRPQTASSSRTSLSAVAKKKKKASSKTTEVVTVKKSELVAQMADMCDLSKKDTEAALNAFLEVIQQNVEEGKKISLVGFGSFSLKERSARKGRNPQTGEELDIPASKSVGFSAGKAFKDRVNGK